MEYAILESEIFCCISLTYPAYEYSKIDFRKGVGAGIERCLMLVGPLHAEVIPLIKNN